MRKHFRTAKKTADISTEARHRRSYYKGYQQQKSYAEHHRERQQALPYESPDALAGLWLDAPNGIERSLQLPDNAGRAKDQGYDPDDGRDDPCFWLAARVLNHPLDRLGALLTYHSLDRSDNLLL